jgi:hypothetical protein
VLNSEFNHHDESLYEQNHDCYVGGHKNPILAEIEHTCTLDDRDVLEKALKTPEVLLDDLGARASIDEAQRAPGLFVVAQ